MFTITTLGKSTQDMLLQYVTKRYHWSWSTAGFLLSLRAFINLVVLLILLPTAGYLLITILGFNGQTKDLWMSRLSILLLTVGAVGIGFSETPAVMTAGVTLLALGSGFNFLLRSLLTSIVEKKHYATLFNSIGVLENIGKLLAGPLLAKSFRAGLELDGVWIGLPFMVAGILFAVATLTMGLVRLPRPVDDDVVLPASSSEEEDCFM